MPKKQQFIQLSIPKPCSENWDDMRPVQGGRHCQQCAKKVVDFTSYGDAELARYLQRQSGQICGQVRTDQLNRTILIPKSPTRLQTWRATGILLAGMFLTQSSAAQSEVISPISIEQDVRISTTSTDDPVRGKVTDVEGEPLIGVNIVLKNSQLGTVSDLDGSFILNIPAEVSERELIFSYIGMEEVSVSVTSSSPLSIVMQVAEHELPTAEITALSGIRVRGMMMGGIMSIGTEEEQPFSKLPPFEFPATDTHLENTAFPNPFTHQLNVKLQVPTAATYLLELYDVQGKLVFAEAKNLSNGQQAVALDQLPNHLLNGAYLLKVTHEDGTHIMTQQVIKSNTY